jgi:uncharacterized membrane protein
MRKRKWFIPVVVVSVLLIGGIVGGVVVAADDSSVNIEDQSQVTNRNQVLLERVCAIYEENTGVAIDSEQLKDALKQARSELRDEALEKWLQNLVSDGKITEQEAGQLLDWWQSRPDVELPLPGFGGPGPGSDIMQGKGFQRWGGPCFVPDASPESSA